MIAAYRIVLACELVAAVRALRLRGIRPAGCTLADAFDAGRRRAVRPTPADRPLDGDLAAAQRLLPELAALLTAMVPRA